MTTREEVEHVVPLLYNKTGLMYYSTINDHIVVYTGKAAIEISKYTKETPDEPLAWGGYIKEMGHSGRYVIVSGKDAKDAFRKWRNTTNKYFTYLEVVEFTRSKEKGARNTLFSRLYNSLPEDIAMNHCESFRGRSANVNSDCDFLRYHVYGLAKY